MENLNRPLTSKDWSNNLPIKKNLGVTGEFCTSIVSDESDLFLRISLSTIKSYVCIKKTCKATKRSASNMYYVLW